MIEAKVHDCLEGMVPFIESADYAGYDPYDALNSPLLRCVTASSRWARMLTTQMLRRSMVNLRPLLGVRKGHNPKAIGLFLRGYSKLYALRKEPHYLSRIKHLLELLMELRSAGYSGNCWGYNFDWQSRTFFAPRFTPTIVNSSFIGHALLDTYDYTGLPMALNMAIPIKDFILNDLNRIKDDSMFCFSYTPVDDYPVHNANLLGASLLIRLSGMTGDDSLRHPALSAMAYSMKYQKSDGSWQYSERKGFNWIDSFHTGFNLEAVRHFLRLGFAREYYGAYTRGRRYYADTFFLEDGTPKYYHDRVYPIDIHSPAQAICFFAREGSRYHDLTDRITHWMLQHMYSGKGFFYFRKGRVLTNRIAYMRWSQAWAFQALTEYLLAQKERADSCSPQE
jgi:hypothetical protein